MYLPRREEIGAPIFNHGKHRYDDESQNFAAWDKKQFIRLPIQTCNQSRIFLETTIDQSRK